MSFLDALQSAQEGKGGTTIAPEIEGRLVVILEKPASWKRDPKPSYLQDRGPRAVWYITCCLVPGQRKHAKSLVNLTSVIDADTGEWMGATTGAPGSD